MPFVVVVVVVVTTVVVFAGLLLILYGSRSYKMQFKLHFATLRSVCN